MLTVFFFARLWRRSGVMTDIEFCEIRYSGKPAAALRGFRALYLGLPVNCIILGWVNLAMVKILQAILGVTKTEALLIVLGLIALTSWISTMSGLWGVLVTDAFQFVVKMGMVIVLAVVAVQAVGGIGEMKTKLAAIDAARQAASGAQGSVLDFVPDLNSAWMPLIAFLAFISLNWWAVWYPGAEPGGGGYVAQRMFCAKDEKHSLLATLWFNIAHYSIRPWPWVLVGLASIILYPDLKDKESGYLVVMVNHLPASLRGLMVAAFAAAYMSTIATQLNWGASYLVNDFYRRFVRKDAAERHYVSMSQVATVLVTIGSALITYAMDSIGGAWQLLMALSAGTGGVLLLRWFWWRVNAWSEISAMAASLVCYLGLRFIGGLSTDNPKQAAWMTIITVTFTTVTWLVVTFLTKPEREETLLSFYRRVRPSSGWGPVAAKAPEVKVVKDGGSNLLCWISGCAMIYCSLFGVGQIILQHYATGSVLLVISVVAGITIYQTLNRKGWASVVD
jgi:Na+/proline symporter